MARSMQDIKETFLNLIRQKSWHGGNLMLEKLLNLKIFFSLEWRQNCMKKISDNGMIILDPLAVVNNTQFSPLFSIFYFSLFHGRDEGKKNHPKLLFVDECVLMQINVVQWWREKCYLPRNSKQVAKYFSLHFMQFFIIIPSSVSTSPPSLLLFFYFGSCCCWKIKTSRSGSKLKNNSESSER